MNGNPPASGEVCARAFDALLQAIMRSGHFFNSLNEWRISCFSVGGARAFDEVCFTPLSRPRSRHQRKTPTHLIL